jgi:lysophospholipase L1-like esterase
MRRWLPELIALPLLPFLFWQGKRTRRITPRLPEAQGPTCGATGSSFAGRPLKLLTVGESPVAGVGVDMHENAITGQFAAALAREFRRPIEWRACGRNGVTVREALQQVVPAIPVEPVDLALIAFGVNDTTAFRPVARWRDDLSELVEAVKVRCRPQLILLSGVPPVGRFPALPQPLRAVMGLKANALDAATRDIAAAMPQVLYVPLALDPAEAALMAHDGYHPSAAGCVAWGSALANACRHHPALSSTSAP